jgi:hypothetical protein
MQPMGPPYHDVAGNNITVYLNLILDSDAVGGPLDPPIDNIVAQLNSSWPAMLNAFGLTLTFAFSSTTANPTNPIPGVILGATPPTGVNFFNLSVGRGRNARAGTQSARLSYVTYGAGLGYIYILPNMLPTRVPDVTHEMGHILGLTDRYYEGIYWLIDWAINRTCTDIRKSIYVVGINDFRDGVTDAGGAFNNSPRLAVRATMPMDIKMIPQETAFNATANPNGYLPCTNLMSTGAATLSAYQVSIIVGKDQTGKQSVEPGYRKKNWVAVLGPWQANAATPSTQLLTARRNEGACVAGGQRYPVDLDERSSWIFPLWESDPSTRPLDKGSGLLFLRTMDVTPRPYPCLSLRSLGREEPGENQTGEVVNALRLAIAKGKKRLPGSKSIPDKDNVVNPNWMCYVRRMIRDLL